MSVAKWLLRSVVFCNLGSYTRWVSIVPKTWNIGNEEKFMRVAQWYGVGEGWKAVRLGWDRDGER